MDSTSQASRGLMTQQDFTRLSAFIHANFGIKMPPAKKTMLESRLHKRLSILGLDTFRDYCDYLFSKEGRNNEMVFFINKITTNKTDFFRESNHFDYLSDHLLPAFLQQQIGKHRPVKIWSAGCSTGEEPYTMAMVLNNFALQHDIKGYRFKILATDISQEVLYMAKNAVYEETSIEKIDMTSRKRYLLKSRDRNKRLIRIAPEVRAQVDFQMLNLMDDRFDVPAPFDVIFCRNVIIYFDKPTQFKLMKKFCECLSPHGYLFLGHSETLHGFDLPIKQIHNTVYQRNY